MPKKSRVARALWASIFVFSCTESAHGAPAAIMIAEEAQCLNGFKNWQSGRYHFAAGRFQNPYLAVALKITSACEAAYPVSQKQAAISSQLCLGFFLQQQYFRAMPYCLAGLASNRDLSATVLGAIYLSEKAKVPPEYRERARYWLEQAIDGGAAWTMRLMGKTVEQENRKDAAEWFDVAARHGDIQSMLELIRFQEPTLRQAALENALGVASNLHADSDQRSIDFVFEICKLAMAQGSAQAALFYDNNKERLRQFGVETGDISQVMGWAVALQFAKEGLHDVAIERMRVLTNDVAALPKKMLSGLYSRIRRHISSESNIDQGAAIHYAEMLLLIVDKYAPDDVELKKSACEMVAQRYASSSIIIARACGDA